MKNHISKNTHWKSAAARRLLDMAGHPLNIEEAIQIVVNKFLQNISCPPTDLEALKPLLNISEFCSEEMPISGELRRVKDAFVIVYSSYLSSPRRRFTIAHEMGHAIFEKSGPKCPRFGDELERLCDMLATEILMPKDIFSKLADGTPSITKLFELAYTFKTSLSATAIRYAQIKEASVFEVENESINWGFGVIKKGNIKSLDSHLKQSIIQALSETKGSITIPINNKFWNGTWLLEWSLIAQGKRALFLLWPIRPPRNPLLTFSHNTDIQNPNPRVFIKR